MRIRPVGPTTTNVGLAVGVGLVMLLLTIALAGTTAWGNEAMSPPQIIPGVGIGPARLGMPETQARQLLAAAGLTDPGCDVDVLADRGRVVALGTRFGGCIVLSLPRLTRLGRVANAGGLVVPEFGGIAGSAGPLFREFGEPRRFAVNRTIAVLLWPTGLVARTVTWEADEVITYLGIVPAGTTVPPYRLLIPLR